MGDRFDRSRSRPGQMGGRDRRGMALVLDEGVSSGYSRPVCTHD